MRHTSRLLTATIGLLLLMSLASSAAFAQDPANGQLIWEEQSNCKMCHGDAGEGKWAGPLAGSTKSAEEWMTQVRTPRRAMPAYSAEQVSDEAIMDIHAYLASLEAPAGDFSPMDAGLPADASAGQTLNAQKRCIACHSETGPINGFINRGEMPTVETVLAQVRTPRQYMPAYSAEQISDDDVAQIVEFLSVQVSEQLGTTTEESAEEMAAEETSEEAATEEMPAEEMAAEEMPAEETSEMPMAGGANSWPIVLLVGSLALAGGAILRRRSLNA